MVAHARRKLLGGGRQGALSLLDPLCPPRLSLRTRQGNGHRLFPSPPVGHPPGELWPVQNQSVCFLLSRVLGTGTCSALCHLPTSCSSHFPLPTGRQDERDGRKSFGSLTGGKSKAETEIRVSGSVSGSVPRVTREGRWAKASAYNDAVIAELRGQGGREIVQLAGPATEEVGMAPVPYPIRLLSTQPTRHNTGTERDPRGSRADVP